MGGVGFGQRRVREALPVSVQSPGVRHSSRGSAVKENLPRTKLNRPGDLIQTTAIGNRGERLSSKPRSKRWEGFPALDGLVAGKLLEDEQRELGPRDVSSSLRHS